MTMVAITGFTDSTTAEMRDFLEDVVSNHSDTLILIANAATRSRSWVIEVELHNLDPERLVFNLIGAHGTLHHEVPFSKRISGTTDLQIQLFKLIDHARKANPEAPVTSLEAEIQERAAIPTHVATVAATCLIAKTTVQVTLTGLHAPVCGGDEFWYLMVPQPGAPDEIRHGFAISQLETIPDNRRPMAAYYTTRRRRPEDGEIDLWIHLHHDTGVAGWAATAQIGDTVALWGPRATYDPPEGTSHHLLVVDETGMPAAAAITEALSPDHPVTLIAEIEAPGYEPPLKAGSNVDLRWVYRSQRGASLSKTVAALELNSESLYAFGAANSQEISAVRKHLRRDRAMSASAVSMTGYWRREREASS